MGRHPLLAMKKRQKAKRPENSERNSEKARTRHAKSLANAGRVRQPRYGTPAWETAQIIERYQVSCFITERQANEPLNPMANAFALAELL